MQQLPTKNEILETLFKKWSPQAQTEYISTDMAYHRVLAKDYHARYAIPVVRASAMDGVAVQSQRFEQGIPDTSDWKLGRDYCRADTGDDFDDRFDAVIPIEDVSISEDGCLKIVPEIQMKPGLNIRPSGSTIQQGVLVGKKNSLLRPLDLARLAMGGVSEIEVYQKPKVAFIPTGSELVALGTTVERGKNIDSNSILAKNMLIEMGADPILFPIIGDFKDKLELALEQALTQADIVILSGGSSKGEEDFNARLLEERGAALYHWVATAPGKPMCVAIIDNKPVINIPGPPVAMLNGLKWCIQPLVYRLLQIPVPKRPTICATLTEEIVTSPNMEIFCMMEVEHTSEGYYTKQKPWKGGSAVNSLSADAFYISELGCGIKNPGEQIEISLLRDKEEL